MSGFAEHHDELRAVARDLLADRGVAATLDDAAAADAGWSGMEVPEALGGAGATFAETAIVATELGRALTSSSHLATAVLGVGTLLAVEPTPARDDLLADVAAGRATLAVALVADPDGTDTEPPAEVVDGRLVGSASFVADAPTADRLLVHARHGDDRVVVALDLGESASEGVDVATVPVLDETRRLGRVHVDVDLGRREVWALDGDPEAAARQLADRAAVALACDGLGLAEAMLDATVAYACDRHQFGRPIGSFQAVKHACADMAVAIAISRELVDAAVAAAIEGAANDGSDEPSMAASRAASMAKAHATETAVAVAGAAMQLHGGIGYTWEHPVHRYLKRATLDRAWFGSPAAHRRRMARLLGGQ
jgi:alkylation response protein AidB-like acyl-CoA dehydrogenase